MSQPTSPADHSSPSTPPEATGSDPTEAQRERAQQTWVLRVDEDPRTLDPTRTRALFGTLRVKRFERDAFLAGLPGSVRRGARVDLLPLLEALTEAGIGARLERRSPATPPERTEDR